MRIHALGPLGLPVRGGGDLALVSKIGSGGVMPVSLTVYQNTLYALNAGDATHPGQISGFGIHPGGLLPIPASTQPLSAAQVGPAQIQFVLSGAVLVVTEKGTNNIDTYPVTAGVAGAPKTVAASSTTPYGFAVSAGGEIVVSEAHGGPAATGSTSSYSVAADGTLTAISHSIVSSQVAPCWVAIAAQTAYVANAASNNITAYTVSAAGALTLVSASGADATTGKGPADLAVTADGAFLYTRNGGDHSFSVLKIAADGTLTAQPDFVGSPVTAVGIVAR